MGCWAKLKTSGWMYPTTVLSLYGFFANCRVAEPFLTPYLIGPNKNISGEVVRPTSSLFIYQEPVTDCDIYRWYRIGLICVFISRLIGNQLPVSYLDVLLPGLPLPGFPPDRLPEVQAPHCCSGALPCHQLYPALLCTWSSCYDFPSGKPVCVNINGKYMCCPSHQTLLISSTGQLCCSDFNRGGLLLLHL